MHHYEKGECRCFRQFGHLWAVVFNNSHASFPHLYFHRLYYVLERWVFIIDNICTYNIYILFKEIKKVHIFVLSFILEAFINLFSFGIIPHLCLFIPFD